MANEPCPDLVTAAERIASAVRASPLAKLSLGDESLQRTSLYANISKDEKESIVAMAMERGDKGLLRAMGAMVGMAVADAVGHNFEFLPAHNKICKTEPYLEYPADTPGGRVHGSFNQFMLKPGQWTDDASMALCMADSLVVRNQYDGANIRVWFWNWWNNGLNNAFRNDEERQKQFAHLGSLSVGLGGNINASLKALRPGQQVPPRFERDSEDAGNGSLMRLAPVPIWCHRSVEEAERMAYESSLTTHPGAMAAEACAFLAHLTVRAIHREDDSTIKEFIDVVVAEYIAKLEAREKRTAAADVMLRLLRANEPSAGNQGTLQALMGYLSGGAPPCTEAVWNWKSEHLAVEETLQARGGRYNGYPSTAAYFGSFSIDGLAVALHSAYTTTSCMDALVKCINFRGDADTTGAICGQIVGAFYGVEAVDDEWRRWLRRWDDDDIALRAVLLYTLPHDSFSP